ncbi:hypothetical protein Tco_0990555 [Tanacetum coccineum]|uniref:Retrotransposon gag domain-containing protein n=1 Tax=Tanacetum coccineum TaxID=301880 RepID=A0ABQ5EWT1_9ASTR
MANLKYPNKHNMVAFLKKPNESVGFTEVVDFLKGSSLRYALSHNPTIYDSLVKQFWQTATVRTLANGTQQLVASIDSKEYTITEASVRSKLQLADATGIHNLSDAEIYAGLATLGYEDPADYPADRGDDDDDALALAEPAAVAYSADQDPYIAYRVAARMSIRTQAPTPFLSEEVAERVLALPTPPPSPLSPYSSPLPQIPSPPLPIPPPSPISPTYVEGSLGSRAAGIRQRDALPVHETEIPEMWLPLRKRLCRTTPGPRCEVGESSAAGAARQFGPTTAEADLYGFTDMLEAAPGRQTTRELGYGITDTWDDLVGAIQEIAPTTLEGVNQRVIELATTVDQEDEIIYSQLDDARYDRALLRARVNMLDGDRPFHRRTAILMEEEARLSRAAWAQSMDACDQLGKQTIGDRDSSWRLKDSEELKHSDDRASESARPAKIHAESQSYQWSQIVAVLNLGYKMAPRGRPTRTTRSRPVTATPPPVTATPPPVTDPTTTTSVTSAQLQAMIDEGVTAVLAARATTRNGDDSHTSGTGARRNERTVRECTYQDFMKCQPLFFKGTEGVVSLTQWFERMETVFRISNCTVENQVKFATCTLMGTALTWWNSHARTVTNEVAYAMTWSDLKKKMTTKYCPRNEIKKVGRDGMRFPLIVKTVIVFGGVVRSGRGSLDFVGAWGKGDEGGWRFLGRGGCQGWDWVIRLEGNDERLLGIGLKRFGERRLEGCNCLVGYPERNGGGSNSLYVGLGLGGLRAWGLVGWEGGSVADLVHRGYFGVWVVNGGGTGPPNPPPPYCGKSGMDLGTV